MNDSQSGPYICKYVLRDGAKQTDRDIAVTHGRINIERSFRLLKTF